MAYTRLSMRKTREILRLHHRAALSNRAIARSLKLSASTVSECLARARAAAVRWPLPGTMTDTALEQALYPPPPERSVPRPLPAWATVHQELKRKGVTLMLLWEEYKAAHPNGVMYSAFCDHYRAQVAVSSTSSCAKTIAPAINSSSTMPVKPCPSSTATPVRLTRHRSSSPCSALPTTPTPKRR